MKKHPLILCILAGLLYLVVTGRSSGRTDILSIFGEALPEEITSIEMSGFYNGSDLDPWELTQEEIEELGAWLPELSLKHRTYAEGEAPNEVWSGGTSYQFYVNDGALSFTWSYSDKAYIVYGGEWYEIKNHQTPPLRLAV